MVWRKKFLKTLTLHRGYGETERRSELGEIGGGDKPRETVDSEKQTEGFEGEREWGWVSLVVVIKEGTIAWSTGCGA